jgi:hypothetical protein
VQGAGNGDDEMGLPIMDIAEIDPTFGSWFLGLDRGVVLKKVEHIRIFCTHLCSFGEKLSYGSHMV